MKYGKPSLSLTLNGILAGLVGITAGCDTVSPAGAALIGAICGVVMIFSVDFIDKFLKIDDPVGASSVHGVCGFLGTILTGLFSTSEGLFYGYGFAFRHVSKKKVLTFTNTVNLLTTKLLIIKSKSTHQ